MYGQKKKSKERNRNARELIKKLQGKFSESYAPLGTLFLEINENNSYNLTSVSFSGYIFNPSVSIILELSCLLFCLSIKLLKI